jgi:hypothetical protein
MVPVSDSEYDEDEDEEFFFFFDATKGPLRGKLRRSVVLRPDEDVEQDTVLLCFGCGGPELETEGLSNDDAGKMEDYGDKIKDQGNIQLESD